MNIVIKLSGEIYQDIFVILLKLERLEDYCFDIMDVDIVFVGVELLCCNFKLGFGKFKLDGLDFLVFFIGV